MIHLSTKRIKNISQIDTEIGQINFIVPDVVIKELERLEKDPNKRKDSSITLDFTKNLPKVSISGQFADQAIIDYVKKHGGIIATIDKELKNKIKNFGGSVISLSNDRIVLEPS